MDKMKEIELDMKEAFLNTFQFNTSLIVAKSEEIIHDINIDDTIFSYAIRYTWISCESYVYNAFIIPCTNEIRICNTVSGLNPKHYKSAYAIDLKTYKYSISRNYLYEHDVYGRAGIIEGVIDFVEKLKNSRKKHF